MWRKFRPVFYGPVVLALMLTLSSFAVAQTEDWLAQWEKFDFAKNTIEASQLEGRSVDDLKMLRGIIFGRHGRVFKDPDIKKYLSERPWFKPNPNFQNSMLNTVERQNLDVIREAESKQHEFIQPGDLRFYVDRVIEPEQLGEHTGGEWRVLSAEVEAIHGRRFDDEPWLQKYFEERYWYEPKAGYDPKELSETERKNLQTILAAHKKQRRLALSPGDMELFQDHPIREEMLHGLSLHELRLLRNEVYARHGMQFRTPWLSQYFFFQPWYMPVEEGQKPSELSAIEKQNVETIVKYERRLHDELATKPISRSMLEGMFREDARKLRNEIYARHGMVFKDKVLRNYFSSLDWYKPDAKYSDASLSAIEKNNAAAILAYERNADSVNDAIEG
ncbi:MAG TPA: YARHG domain-containing protein [Pyrinomonadaceae bacterium]|jgi:hypothetical protein|nr:YARHG domain-containing protein [Pyrinomonadaceae bacterium]